MLQENLDLKRVHFESCLSKIFTLSRRIFTHLKHNVSWNICNGMAVFFHITNLHQQMSLNLLRVSKGFLQATENVHFRIMLSVFSLVLLVANNQRMLYQFEYSVRDKSQPLGNYRHRRVPLVADTHRKTL